VVLNSSNGLEDTNVSERLIRWGITATTGLEAVLASIILAGVIAFGVGSAMVLVHTDWREIAAFYDLINRLLMMAIGVEVVRTLLTHNLGTIVELLALVIARKILKPDVTPLEILLSVLAFVMLLAARHYFLRQTSGTRTAGMKPADSQ
jgi:hypothetical protein